MDHYDEEYAQLERSHKQAELRHLYEVEDLKGTMATSNGRAVIWRILEFCGVHRASFEGDANHTFVREGERKVGQRIYQMISELPDGDDLLIKMQIEAKTRSEELKNG